MKKEIKDIIFTKDLYPRFEVDLKKIGEYSENINLLPPIIINQDNILIDGWHRIKAHKQVGLTEIEVIVEETKSDDEIYLRAIELNATHGLQLSYEDKKKIAVTYTTNALERDDDISKIHKRLVNALSIADETYNKWTKNIRDEYNDEIKNQIIQEYLKANLTLEEVAKKFEVSHPYIIKIRDKLSQLVNLLSVTKIEDYDEELKEFVEHHQRLIDFTPYIYNIWRQLEINNEMKHFGNFPIEYMENLLYYYTKPFDVVYDPFAGGGVTIDACKRWYRRYYVSDLNPIPAREEDIKKWDIKEGLPEDLPRPDFVFLDPPYWKQSEGKYSKDKNDLGNMELDKFYDSMKSLFSLLKKKMKDGGYLAFIISGTQWPNNLIFEDHSHKFMVMLDKLGFKEEQRIICPYSTQQYNGNQVDKAKKEKICLNLYRDLVIFKKTNKEAP